MEQESAPANCHPDTRRKDMIGFRLNDLDGNAAIRLDEFRVRDDLDE